jgi:SSS family solute:Na+ symporter
MYVLPPGISGLIIAGLLAEAMNSLSSGVNATSTVIVTDLVQRYRRTPGKSEDEVRLARVISVLIGVVVVLLSTFMMYVHGNLFEVSFKVVNLFVAPLFGLFFMALFVRWATATGTLVGVVCGVSVAVVLNFWEEATGEKPPVGFMYVMLVSLTVQIAVGLIVSIFPLGIRNARRDPEGWQAIDDAALGISESAIN